MTTFSVVIPMYNVQLFIEQAIESVLAQEFCDFELIVVDDCSTDRSLAIVQQYDDPRIKIIRHPHNKGLAAARNTGILASCGEFIAFLDSDDAWRPDKLQAHFNHFNQNTQLGLSFSRSEFMTYEGKPTGCYQMPKLTDISAIDMFCRNPVGNGSAGVFRRQALFQIQYSRRTTEGTSFCFFDEDLRQSEDIECWTRFMLSTNWRVEGITEALTLYRLNQQGLSANLDAQYQSWLKVLHKFELDFPAFAQQVKRPAMAYQLRYLARQAIRTNDGEKAVGFFWQSLKTDPEMILMEPARTLATGGSAIILKQMPKLFRRSEKIMMKVWSFFQRISLPQRTP